MSESLEIIAGPQRCCSSLTNSPAGGKPASQLGFTRVRARSKGVCGSPKLAAAEKQAVRTTSGLTAFRSSKGQEKRQSCKPVWLFVELLSPILIRQKLASGCCSGSLSKEDHPPCKTSLSLLVAQRFSMNSTTLPPDRRTLLAVSTSACKLRLTGFHIRGRRNGQQADPLRQPLLETRWTSSNAAAQALPQLDDQHSDGQFRSSQAIEQDNDLRMATSPKEMTSRRTRRPQRVLHEERNARQRLATGRKPHCDY